MILETLSKIIHPAADKDIVSLGLVEDIKLFDGNGAAVEEGRAGALQVGGTLARSPSGFD